MNSLKQLRPPNFIESHHPGEDCRIQSEEYSYSVRNVEKLVPMMYKQLLKHKRQQLNDEFIKMYGTPLHFNDDIVSDVFDSMIKLFNKTGKYCLGEIADEFYRYFGHKCSFYRWIGTRRIPVSSLRIMNAWIAMKNKQTPAEVKRVLYT